MFLYGNLSGCSLVWLKAPALGAGDREFESHFPDQFNAGRQVKGPPAAFQAEDRGVRLSLPAPMVYKSPDPVPVSKRGSIVCTIKDTVYTELPQGPLYMGDLRD